MTIREVRLDQLQENDYNPRKTFSDAKMQDLIESIEKVDLVQPLTVREIKRGTYEVIAGVRRLRALQELGIEEDIPVNVLDVDREEAKLISLTENLERATLTPMEEAKAFSEYVEVLVTEDLAKAMRKSDYDIRVEENRKTRRYAKFNEYVEFLKKDPQFRDYKIKIPGSGSKSVEGAAETIPGVTAAIIERRIKLLLLPDALQTAVDNKEITQQVAIVLTRLREIRDLERMEKEMLILGKKRRYRGAEPDVDKLKEKIDNIIRKIEKKKKRRTELFGEWLRVGIERREKLEDTLSAALDTDEITAISLIQSRVKEKGEEIEDAMEEVVSEIEGVEISEIEFKKVPEISEEGNIMKRAENVENSLKQITDTLSTEREDEIDKEIGDFRRKKDDLERTAERMRKEDLDECPYCHSVTDAPTLEKEADELYSKIQEKEKEVESVSKKQSDLRDKQRDLRKARQSYEDGLNNLMEEEVVLIKETETELEATLDVDVGEIEDFEEKDEERILQDSKFLVGEK